MGIRFLSLKRLKLIKGNCNFLRFARDQSHRNDWFDCKDCHSSWQDWCEDTLKATKALVGIGGAGTVSVALLGFGPSSPDWKQIREELADLINDSDVVNPSKDDGVQGGGGFVAPMMLRLAWHCSGTWCKAAKNGGSDGGTMRFKPECDHGGNAGLGIARKLLEPIKARHPDVTYADLYILAGVVAIEEMGGPKVAFRWGRSDANEPKDPKDDTRFSPDGRLPDAAQHAAHLRHIFNRMGFDDRAIVALSGAHAVGRCHTDRSGFYGPWTHAESTMSNEYYRLIFEEEWTEKKTHHLPEQGTEWKGPRQFTNKNGDLMMLPTDLALKEDPDFKVWAEKYYKDEELWFKDFAKYCQQLNELGCEHLLKSEVPWYKFW